VLFRSGLVLLVMSLLVFVGVFAIGNPIDILINPDADQEEIERAIKALGLDKPMWEQYWIFLVNALHGDLGRSFVFNIPALQLIWQRMPATLELAACAMFLSVFIGIPLGMLAGLKPESWVGRTIMSGSILGFSLPTFWVGLMMILFFAVYLGWLPASGRGETVDLLGVPVSFLTLDGLSHLLLPAINLALFKLSLTIRLARAGTREAMLMDYVKFARAKGLSKTHQPEIIHFNLITGKSGIATRQYAARPDEAGIVDHDVRLAANFCSKFLNRGSVCDIQWKHMNIRQFVQFASHWIGPPAFRFANEHSGSSCIQQGFCQSRSVGIAGIGNQNPAMFWVAG